MTSNDFESEVVNGAIVVSEVPPDELTASLEGGLGARLDRQVYRALASWAEDSQGSMRNRRGIFHRDKYVTPGEVYKQMAVATDSLDDDVVGNVADVSEAMAFQKVTFETQDDKDQENVWHQIGEDIDLDAFVRRMWRELFTVSQCYPVKWWGQKTYRVDEKREKRKARKEYNIEVPVALGLLDPTRVVPVGLDPFGNNSLAWIVSSDEEMQGYSNDEFMNRLFLGPYEPSAYEAQQLEKEGVEVDKLMLLNPAYVWSHTLTKSPYERWSRIRMKSVFPLLDLKHQLREMDRAWLLGGINFIVLVTRGSDQQPTTKTEVEATAAQVRGQSRSPIIVSDHRISIEIITPDIQHVLDDEKWDVLDQRLMGRLWGMFVLPNDTGNRETSMTMGRVIARGLASRRHMIRRSIEENVIRPTYENQANKEAGFGAKTFLEFAPRRMELEFDPAVVNMIQQLRDRGDMSRETVLTEFGFDQALEASRREYEDEKYEDVFKPVNVPFDSPNKGNPDQSGRQGGRPPGSNQNQEQQQDQGGA
jgi:uncharacterized protein YehS (DUF1456 family)